MRGILTGQIFLIICFIFYMIWWYRGYRPGTSVKRARGANGLLLLLTAGFGIAGIAFSLSGGPVEAPRIQPGLIAIAGAAAYILLLIVTRAIFHRKVTTELILIVGWTALEVQVVNVLTAMGKLTNADFDIMCVALGLAFIISLALYVAYYRMDEVKAFYAAMVPLAIGVASTVLLLLLLF